MWHALKWTLSVYRWVINTATVQAYITHLMLVRGARAVFDVECDVWHARQLRLRNSPAPITPTTEEEEKKERKKRIAVFENKFNRRRPQPMTHVQFRVSLITSLASDVLGETGQTPHTPTRGPVRAAAPVTRRAAGRPTAETVDVPNRTTAKRNLETVMVVCGADRQDRKRVRVTPRLMSTKRLSAGRKKRYDIDGDKSMERFAGGQCIPGMHVLMPVPKGKSFKCQVCRATGELRRGVMMYGADKKLRQPPRAKFTCTNKSCGGLSMCGAQCYNKWHFHPDLLQ